MSDTAVIVLSVFALLAVAYGLSVRDKEKGG